MKQLYTRLLICLLAGMAINRVSAQVGPINLGDINTVNKGSSPQRGVRFASGTKYLFTARTSATGDEPWVTDGTTEGTMMLGDWYPGTSGSRPRSYVTDGNIVYFAMETPTHGLELFKTDGTPQGTSLVKDIRPGVFGSDARNLLYVNRTLYFLATDQTGSGQLWKSNGTEAGTMRVRTDSNYADIQGMIGMGNTLYFWGYLSGQSSNMWLWKTDGTQAGTVRVQLLPGGVPSNITTFNNKLLFTLTDASTGNELWISDGTNPATLLKDIEPGNLSSDIQLRRGITVGNTFYFSASNSEYGNELWKTDGTPAGTMMVKDIFPGPQSGGPNYFAVLDNGTFLFRASDSLRRDGELWKSDGTTAGTQLLKAIGNPEDGESSPESFISTGDAVYFSAYQLATGYELWKSDGTEEGTVFVKDINPGDEDGDFDPFAALGNKVVFMAYNHPEASQEMFVTDGTEVGTGLLKNIGGSKSSRPQNMVELNGDVYFAADPGDGENYLYRTNGNPNSTVLISPKLRTPQFLTVFQNKLYFQGTTDSVGQELYVYDPLTNKVSLVQDLSQGIGDTYINGALVAFNNDLYFSASVSGLENGLYKFNGTQISTVINSVLNNEGTAVDNLTVGGGFLYFTSTDSAHGNELWRTNGTLTELVVDVKPGPESSLPSNLVWFQGALYMVANPMGGTELFKVVNKTATLIDFDPNSTQSSEPSKLAVGVGSLFVSARTAALGYEVYAIRNDSIIFFGEHDLQNDFPGFIEGIEFDGQFYMTVGTSGATPSANDRYRLWRSDGYTMTRLSKVDVEFPQRFIKLGCNLFFEAKTQATGEEMWMLKKGEDTATLAIEMVPGPMQSDFDRQIGANGSLYFSFEDPSIGKELWKYTPATAGSSSNATICFGESFAFNGLNRTTSGSYQKQFSTREGCDSLVTLNLTVRPKLETRFPYTLCNGTRLVLGTVVIEDSGAYTAVIKSVTGCDSTLVLDVSVTPQINHIRIDGSTITAVTGNAVYRWVTCPDYALAPGNATSQSYTAESDGSYAVIVQDGECIDTSACVTVSVPTGLQETTNAGALSVYPNPNNGTCYVTANREGTFKLINQLGQTLQEFKLDASNQYRVELKQLAQGMYFVTGNNMPTLKVVVDK